MRIILLSVLLFVLVVFSSAQQEVPIVHQRINDETGTLSPDEITALESTLAQFEKETSNQIVVLMVPSTQGDSFEDYSLRVAEKNRLGKKGRDNGILLFIAKEDHNLRIEVGYGLEGSLPDAISDQIIRRVIIPKFKQNDFFGGIQTGLEAIMQATKGEYKAAPEDNGIKKFKPLIVILMILLFGVLPRIFGGGRRHYVGSSGYYSGGGFFGGFSGGSSGGGGGFGGFSGGGGSFGGGGASGSW
jgi:uncharacterized protein